MHAGYGTGMKLLALVADVQNLCCDLLLATYAWTERSAALIQKRSGGQIRLGDLEKV